VIQASLFCLTVALCLHEFVRTLHTNVGVFHSSEAQTCLYKKYWADCCRKKVWYTQAHQQVVERRPAQKKFVVIFIQ